VDFAARTDFSLESGIAYMSCRAIAFKMFFFFALASQPANSQDKYRVYLGTYTDEGSQGIYQCELNLKDGTLSAATLAGESVSPSFLAVHPNRNLLYAVNE
jgi:6-phosphogluconolactonase